MRHRILIVLTILTCFPYFLARAQTSAVPHLEKHGTATQLVVDGKPFLILGAELHNSSSSSLDYMEPLWARMAAIPLNTLITPLSWELIEPQEGKFDFTLVDGLIQGARQNNLRLVFLWLASWKNGMSSYAPLWVKENTRRFPRVVEKEGKLVEVLSPLGKESRESDARAFAALMRHIREVDGEAYTVLMMQVENEVGILGDSRDRSPAANQAFAGQVPSELTSYLQQHRTALIPEFQRVWEAAGAKTSGTWQDVFGPGVGTDKIFMAWNYARYIQYVTAAGKAQYALPMYVNTWLEQPHALPGDYPSGGPLPEVIDVWKAAGSAIDIYSPDIYAPNFSEWCDRYTRGGNPLFIPEAHGGDMGEGNVFYAIGQSQAIGFSPFGIDSFGDNEPLPLTDPNIDLGKSYRVLLALAPLILQHQSEGTMAGFVLDKDHPQTTIELNGYQLDVRLDEIFETKSQKGFGLVMATGHDEFLGAGGGFRVVFHRKSPGPAHIGIAAIDEGTFSGGGWIPGRRLNGDEDAQGEYWRFSPQGVHIEKVTLYRYE